MKKFMLLLLISILIPISCFSQRLLNNQEANSTNIASVIIGNQEWMIKNLNVETYRNGDVIPQVTNLEQWKKLKTGAWCYYDYDSRMGPVNGKLYNWYAVNDSRGLAPLGWHIPNLEEWELLFNNLGGSDYAGGKLKEKGTKHWQLAENTCATNSCGFTALPGGRLEVEENDGFDKLGYCAYFWSTSDDGFTNSHAIVLINADPRVSTGGCKTYKSSYSNRSGFSVRCLKDK